MDDQQRHYLPGPPPLASQQGPASYLPPPPPRQQMGMPPPPQYPPGTFFGIPQGWNQSYGRPNMGHLPPPPPMNMNVNPQQYNIGQFGTLRGGQTHLPPPPRRSEDPPLLSATFIPSGDSFGPGVGIPALDEYSNFSGYDGNYDPAAYAEPAIQQGGNMYSQANAVHASKPASAGPESGPREHRASSAASNKIQFPPMRDGLSAEPLSPGLPTATLVNPNPGRPRAQSAMAPQPANADLANQWPLDTVLNWLASNNFSAEWQETFRVLRLEKAQFLELGAVTDERSNLGRMHQYIYPQLGKICQHSGSDPKKERKEGKKLQRMIAEIIQGGGTHAGSAGIGHRRRESGLASASTEGTLENSPHPGTSATPSTTGPEGSPARSHFGPNFGQRMYEQQRSSTLPVYPRSGSNGSTPAERQHAESFGPYANTRTDATRGLLSGIGAASRGRHSPNLSGDASVGSLPVQASPGHSPALGHSLPNQAQSTPHLPSQIRDAQKAQSVDSFSRAAGLPRHPASNNLNLNNQEAAHGAGRFYENQKDRTETRPDVYRAYSNEQNPSKDHKANFVSKLFARRKHDNGEPIPDEHSPTSPRSDFMQKLPFTKAHGNHSDTSLTTRPHSATLPSESPELLFRNTPKRFIMVTPDFWNYRLIDVTDIESAIALKHRIGSELAINDMDLAHLYVTEPGRTDHDEPLSDAALAAARGTADPMASLKLFVKSPSMAALTNMVTPAESVSMLVHQRNTSSGSQGPPMTEEELRKASEVHQEEMQRRKEAWYQSRKDRWGQTSETGTPIVDFDKDSPRFFDNDKTDQLKPLRKPPAAPSASQTLTKVNSLRMTSQHRSRPSLDGKRLPDTQNDDSSPRKGTKFDPTGGIAAAIASSGKMAVLPASVNSQKSPRTMTISSNESSRTNPSQRQDSGPSPTLRSALTSLPKPNMADRKRSLTPGEQFEETNVAFAASPNPQAADAQGSDDDSDEGLFAVSIRPKKSDQRPALTVKTGASNHAARKSVAFKDATPSDGASDVGGANETDSALAPRSVSDGYASREDWSPEEARTTRPTSFHSEIWANRPFIENIVEDLDKYFPGVDLDKPYLEERGDEASQSATGATPLDNLKARLGNNVTFGTTGLNLDFEKKSESDTLGSDESTLKANKKSMIKNVASKQMDSGGLSRMKSIREVAQKRNDIQRGASNAGRGAKNVGVTQPQNNANLLRRKSTKMFGANIIQIKPQKGNRLSSLEPIPQEEIPTEEAPHRQATFKIIQGQLIGKGTYGKVYLAMNATTGDLLAVKQVQVSQRSGSHDKDKIAEMVKALEQEIDTMQNLEHPNIVQYLGFDRQQYAMSIYLEYISGGSIGSCLRKHGKFEEPVVKSMTIQTLRGLKYLHDESILHRDLKADNILLDLDGTCKISDFGISKKSEDIYRDDITNSMQGSVFWMAPEVVRTDGQGYSAKVDIWSLGCVVLEMFAGKRPWSREEAIGAIFKLGSLHQAPPIPDDVEATASIDGLAFMYDCFQINPLDRPTAKTLLEFSQFCVPNANYDFLNTELYSKLKLSNVNLMPRDGEQWRQDE